MVAIPDDFGTGLSGLTPQESQGSPTLVAILQGLVADIAGNTVIPVWTPAIAVAGHTVTLPSAGWVVAVDGDTGGTAGGKKIVNAAALTGEVQVVYDAAGIPTLNFLIGDAITQCAVCQIPYVAPTVT